MTTDVAINYAAVLVAAVAAMAIGALWYAPPVFGKLWMQLVGKTPDEATKQSMGKMMGITFVCELLMAYILAHFVQYLGVLTVGAGLELAAWLWLGFVLTTIIINGIYVGRSWKLFVLDSGHYLAVMLAMGAIVAAWQ